MTVTGKTTLDALSRRAYGKTFAELRKLVGQGFAVPEKHEPDAVVVQAALARVASARRPRKRKAAAKARPRKKAAKRRK